MSIHPPHEDTEPRFYGGNSWRKGSPEDPKRCAEEVFTSIWHQQQCSRKRGYGPKGLYCKQHAKRWEK